MSRRTATIRHIGHNICERDADLIAQAGGVVKGVPRQDLIPPLDCGLLSPVTHPANGTLFPQPSVTCGARSGRLDDIAGSGLWLILADAEAADEIAALSPVQESGARVIRVRSEAAGNSASANALDVVEADGIVAAWFVRHQAAAALVRPDHYVYGIAPTATAVVGMVEGFNHAMRSRAAGG